MADLFPKDRLLPCLLDRLIPGIRQLHEPGERIVGRRELYWREMDERDRRNFVMAEQRRRTQQNQRSGDDIGGNKETENDVAMSVQGMVQSPQDLRKVFLRDLRWLLNSRAYRFKRKDGSDPMEDYPEVRRSVLNYGIPDATGMTVGDINLEEYRQRVTEAIRTFEPRIVPGSLKVTMIADGGQFNMGVFGFEIQADLWSVPVPETLYYRVKVALDTNMCEFEEEF